MWRLPKKNIMIEILRGGLEAGANPSPNAFYKPASRLITEDTSSLQVIRERVNSYSLEPENRKNWLYKCALVASHLNI